MSVLNTVDDLRADALFRSGEPPTDTTGSFWSKSLEYLNRIQQQLLLGGSIAVGRDLATSAGIYAHLVDLPMTDWWWARRKGVFNTTARIQGTTAFDLTQGTSTTITFTPTLPTGLTLGMYVLVPNQPTVYRVAGVQPTLNKIELDAAYVDPDLASGAILDLAQVEYDLSGDFIRFASTPYVHSVFGSTCDVSGIEQRNTDWPLSIVRQGRPTRAFMVAPRRIAFNCFDTRPYRCEYEYIAMPDELRAGMVPVMPQHHRATLSAGAAMLISFDRGDGRQAQLASEYRELVGRMVQEHRRAIGGGSSTFGQYRTRQPQIFRRSPQTFGELYLV